MRKIIVNANKISLVVSFLALTVSIMAICVSVKNNNQVVELSQYNNIDRTSAYHNNNSVFINDIPDTTIIKKDGSRVEVKSYKANDNLNGIIVESEDVSSKEKADEFKEEQNEIDKEIQARRNKMMKRGQRSSVSAEVFGLYNKKSAFKPRVIPKKDSQKETIRKRCLQSFIFNSLEDQDFVQVIDAFEEKRFNAGDYVIKEGDQGDVVYLVDTGELDCEKTFKKGDKPTF